MTHVPDGAETVAADLERHRSKIAHGLLVGFGVLGLLAYIPSVWLGVQVRAWEIVVVDTVAYSAILAGLLVGRNRYRLQASVVVGTALMLGTSLSLALGPSAGGPLWLLAAPVTAAILFDQKGAIVSMALVTIVLVAMCVMALTGVVSWRDGGTTAPMLTVVVAANTLLIAAATTFGVVTLISGLKEEMAERARAAAQLRQSEKLTAIGTLAAGIAHDFNNLLTPILSGSEMARMSSEEGSPTRAMLDQSVDAAIAGRELVHRLLAFSRPSGDGRRAMPALEAFSDAIRLLRAVIPGSVTIRLLPSGDGYVMLSVTEVHQIVLNLGTNASRAMNGAGTLTFRLGTLPGGEAGWSAGAEAPADVVRLEVSDTGVGMTADVARRIFEPFYTLDSRNGTGLGLSVVHGIVVSAGGRIGCRSQPGHGATFTIDLPAVTGASVAGTALPGRGTAVSPTGHGRHILVVDDDDAVRDIAARVLERDGFHVTRLADGEAALEELESGADVEAIVSDLHMPGMSGLRLAERVRQQHPGVPLILMSGMVDEALIELAAGAGASSVVAKPFRPGELQDAVRAMLAHARSGAGAADQGA